MCRRNDKASTTLPGKVEKVIQPSSQFRRTRKSPDRGRRRRPSLSRDSRSQTSLTDANGQKVKLKEGAEVEVKIEADRSSQVSAVPTTTTRQLAYSSRQARFQRSIVANLLCRRLWLLRRAAGLANFASSTGTFCFTSVDLDRETSARARQRPAIRNLHSVRFAIIGVVDLRREPSQRSISVAHQPDEQARIAHRNTARIGGFAFTLSHHDVRFVIANLFGSLRSAVR